MPNDCHLFVRVVGACPNARGRSRQNRTAVHRKASGFRPLLHYCPGKKRAGFRPSANAAWMRSCQSRPLDAMTAPESQRTRQMFTAWLDPLMASEPYERALLLDMQLNNTARKKAEAEREHLIKELQVALANVQDTARPAAHLRRLQEGPQRCRLLAERRCLYPATFRGHRHPRPLPGVHPQILSRRLR